MVLVWRITDDLPNSPNFCPTKLSRYTVFNCCRIQFGRSTGERPWLTIEDTVLEQTGILIGTYILLIYT